ncbi:hypothetical protein GMRT_11639 [Giardia muris]|uniref:WD40 repeat protein n=1 Tax=Giardia muris TaxID=5742 RepID=A0A4Z1T8V5_GIAMU|nr:hypothetical protein GMRT_11639 [Giardia muris]|eukprot:TNJ29567.1 hypothetical protein GMRT_11639 [Giardia muris]
MRSITAPRPIRGNLIAIGNDIFYTRCGSIVWTALEPPFETSFVRVSEDTLTAIAHGDGYVIYGTETGTIGVCRCEGVGPTLAPVWSHRISSHSIISLACHVYQESIVLAVSTVRRCYILVLELNTFHVHDVGPVDTQTWPSSAESTFALGLLDSILIAFGSISGMLHLYLWKGSLIELPVAGLNALLSSEAQCAITHISGLVTNESLKGFGDVLLLITFLYARPQLVAVRLEEEQVYSLSTLHPHKGQMFSSCFLTSTELITTGSDRKIFIYSFNPLGGYVVVDRTHTLGADKSEHGRGYISAVTLNDCIIAITGDGALIAYRRQEGIWSRYKLPEGHNGTICSIVSIPFVDDHALVLTASMDDAKVMASLDGLPLCFAVEHGCSIYCIHLLSDKTFALAGDEGTLRIFALPWWLSSCRNPIEQKEGYDGYSSIASYVIPLGGVSAPLTLTVGPVWSVTEAKTMDYRPPPPKTVTDLRNSITHITDNSSDTRLMTGSVRFPEVHEGCSFPGNNCLDMASNGSILLTCSQAGRVTEATVNGWIIYKPESEQVSGREFLLQSIFLLKPWKGQSYVSTLILDNVDAKVIPFLCLTELGSLNFFSIPRIAVVTRTPVEPTFHATFTLECPPNTLFDFPSESRRPQLTGSSDVVIASGYGSTSFTRFHFVEEEMRLREDWTRKHSETIWSLLYDHLTETVYIGSENGIYTDSGGLVFGTIAPVTALHIIEGHTRILVAGDDSGVIYQLPL